MDKNTQSNYSKTELLEIIHSAVRPIGMNTSQFLCNVHANALRNKGIDEQSVAEQLENDRNADTIDLLKIVADACDMSISEFVRSVRENSFRHQGLSDDAIKKRIEQEDADRKQKGSAIKSKKNASLFWDKFWDFVLNFGKILLILFFASSILNACSEQSEKAAQDAYDRAYDEGYYDGYNDAYNKYEPLYEEGYARGYDDGQDGALYMGDGGY